MDVLKDLFRILEPEDIPDGHLERFERKLESQLHQSVFNRIFFRYGYIAAIIILVIILSVAMPKANSNRFKLSASILTLEDSEMVETEQYFQKEIIQRMLRIEDLSNDKDCSILKDLEEFDISLKKLRSDYKQTPGDTRIVNAVLTTYMLKIEAMDKIMSILQKNS
jgi:hypothetical protein